MRSVQRLKNLLHNYSPRRPSCALRGGRVRASVRACASPSAFYESRAEERRTDAERKRTEEERWTRDRVTRPVPHVYRSLRNAAGFRA